MYMRFRLMSYLLLSTSSLLFSNTSALKPDVFPIINKDEILCDAGQYLKKTGDGCTSCLKSHGNYCPGDKKAYCCPPHTEPSRDHAKSVSDCVRCPEGYDSKGNCDICKKIEIEVTKYCYRKVTENGNIYQITDEELSEEWVKIGEEGKVNCDEESKCYIDENNRYSWGKHAGDSKYQEDDILSTIEECFKENEKTIIKKYDSEKQSLIGKFIMFYVGSMIVVISTVIVLFRFKKNKS